MGMVWLGGEDTIALAGMVKDNRGAPIAGALVSVASDASIRRVTGVNGFFRINRQFSSCESENPRHSRPTLAGLGIRGYCLQLLLPTPAPSGSIAISGVDGKKRLELPLGPYGPGAHLVEMPALGAGVYSLWIDLGKFFGSVHLVSTGNVTTLMPRTSVRRHSFEDDRGGSVPRRQPVAAVDALLVRKPGFVTARSPILSYEQAGIAIVMAKEPGLGPETSYHPIKKAGRNAR